MGTKDNPWAYYAKWGKWEKRKHYIVWLAESKKTQPVKKTTENKMGLQGDRGWGDMTDSV